MQSTGPDLTESTTAPLDNTDPDQRVADATVTDTTGADKTGTAETGAETTGVENAAATPELVSEPALEPTTESVAEATPETVPEAVVEAAVTREPVFDFSTAPEPVPVEPEYDQPSLIPIAEGPPPEAARTVFSDLGLSEEVLRAIDDMGYRHPTPIQEQAIPYVLMGRDVMGTAQTGTGKTASFTLPMMDILSGSRARARMPRSLILEPTRELALQVAENFIQYGKYLKLTHALIIGGESMSDQKDILNRGVDVLIATPGRLLDMFDRGSILLTDTRLLVIDEADRMLDMGFIPDVERIVSMLPATRQTLFFSATMGPEIRRLVNAFLTNSKEIAVSRAASVATTITEGLALVAEHDKREALRRLIRSQNVQNALIFCNRKRDVDILHKSLTKHNFDAGALHGDLAQTVRFATLEKFKANELRLLVCSDVAARGIDIGGLSHVFNFDVPIHAEDYVHRIGRTGRAGLEGKAFTIASPEDRYAVEQIEKLINHPIPPVIVEGLDPVDWAEKGARKRRGRTTAEPKKPTERKPREPKEKTEAPRAERTRTARARPERAPQPELPVVVEEQAPVRREDTRRSEARRPEHRRDEPRREESRRDEPRRDEPRRDEFRRERYRREDDLGPAVLGFGDEVPAFMFLRARSSNPTETREADV
ncbi:MAG TPA: DNA helicase [Acetobacteraceae bacterium]|jgi:superfamily II DNA/RNA helicase|nr:DNA helicase [Acetobacteraceae bacterium]